MSSATTLTQTSLPLSWTQTWSDLHHSMVTCIAFSMDGKLLATGDLDGIIFVFDVSLSEPALCLTLDPSVAATSLVWASNSAFWLGASDGSVTCWSVNTISEKLKLVDLLPGYLPASPHVLVLYPELDPEYITIAHCSTVEVWQRQGPQKVWEGLSHLHSKDETDRVVACWPVSSDSAIVAFHVEGIRLWDFREDAQNVVTNWPTATKIHCAHLLHAPPIVSAEDSGVLGQILVISDTAVLHLELSLLPVSHVQILQQFPLMPDMLALSTATMWSMSPVLITPSSIGLIAVDLKYHRYIAASTMQARTTQTIHLDDGTQHRRLASYSGKFGRHVVSAFEGKQGWIVQLWTAADVCSRARLSGLARENQSGTPLFRWNEQLPEFYADREERKTTRSSSQQARVALITSAGVLLLVGACMWSFRARVVALLDGFEWSDARNKERETQPLNIVDNVIIL